MNGYLEKSAEVSAWPFWQFWRQRADLYAAIHGLDRVLVVARIANSFAFALLRTGTVFNEKTVVFPFNSYSAFATMQSRVHELWTRFFSTTLKDDLQYTPSDCFETFPFPSRFDTDPALEQAGRAYYEFRAQLMVANDEGLTKTYNRFHEPDESAAAIAKLRDLHAAMDRAVLDAYGWHDLVPTHDFILDYEEDDDEDDAPHAQPGSRPRKRKKPWRYRWPDDLRDEVLMRLLRLNHDRAEEEKLHAPAPKAKGAATKRGRPRKGDTTPDMFGNATQRTKG